MDDPSHWKLIDDLWEAYISEGPLLLAETDLRSLNSGWGTDLWPELDIWWDSYADSQRQQIVKLRDLLDRMNDEWERSPARFNRDPLTTDWTGGRRSHGPLRINHEEDWSHWFAHLLRASSGAFTHRLFSDEFGETPQSVKREAQFHNPDGMNRRIDLLVEYEASGLSIEVKWNDTNYGKTPETAALVDEQKHGEWTHVLLLPKHKSSRLRQYFADQVLETQEGSLTIVSADYPDVLVLHWETVSRILRETLLAGEESDPHWVSSAYLFISLIEQHISSFETVSPDEERIMTVEEEVNEVSLPTLQRLRTVDVSEQLTHFERILENHNES